MVDLYNFLAAWQLFPERGTYEFGAGPKSGIYKMELGKSTKELVISMNVVTYDDQAFFSHYAVMADGEEHDFENIEVAERVQVKLLDLVSFEIQFYKEKNAVLTVIHEITPKGYLKVIQKRIVENDKELVNTEIYHKQFSVLPYSASVAGAVIKPNEEGIIRHQALSAMEEQTNMQLTQIRQQIELLAVQAREIQKRKELSMLIYDAKMSFAPVIGKTYHLYEQEDGAYLMSLIGPKEWGKKLPFKSFVSSVQLLADHTWKEV